MDLRDVEKVAVDTYRKLSIIEHNRYCPTCKKEVTMIGVHMYDSGQDELNCLGAKSYKRCLGCLTLFEEQLTPVKTRKEIIVSLPQYRHRRGEAKAPKVGKK